MYRRMFYFGLILGLELILTNVAVATDPNLVSWWKFDEGTGSTVYDSVGNYDGTITGGTWTTGMFGGALDFDGTDDYVTITTDPNLNNLGAMTISAWIYPRVDSNWHVLDKGDGDKRIYSEGVNCTLRGLVRYNTASAYTGSVNDTVVLNSWQHVALTWDQTTNKAKIFRNGIEVSYNT